MANKNAAYYLKLDSIKGDATETGVTDQIVIKEFSWGASNPANHSGNKGASTGAASITDFQFVAEMSSASPPLMLACMTGRTLASGEFVAREISEKQLVYFKVKFTDLKITGYSTRGPNGESPRPEDVFTLNPSKFEVEFTPQDKGQAKAPVTAGWDQRTGAKV